MPRVAIEGQMFDIPEDVTAGEMPTASPISCDEIPAFAREEQISRIRAFPTGNESVPGERAEGSTSSSPKAHVHDDRRGDRAVHGKSGTSKASFSSNAVSEAQQILRRHRSPRRQQASGNLRTVATVLAVLLGIGVVVAWGAFTVRPPVSTQRVIPYSPPRVPEPPRTVDRDVSRSAARTLPPPRAEVKTIVKQPEARVHNTIEHPQTFQRIAPEPPLSQRMTALAQELRRRGITGVRLQQEGEQIALSGNFRDPEEFALALHVAKNQVGADQLLQGHDINFGQSLAQTHTYHLKPQRRQRRRW